MELEYGMIVELDTSRYNSIMDIGVFIGDGEDHWRGVFNVLVFYPWGVTQELAFHSHEVEPIDYDGSQF